MKLFLHLILKDFRRVAKKPWVVLIFMLIPVTMSWLMATVFGTGKEEPQITLHVAVLDRDEEFFSGMLRSMSNQGDAAERLQIHLVDNVDEGIRLIEKRKVSALIVMPEHMTADLVDGASVSIDLYKNPAQTILPQIVEQGADIVSVGISGLLSYMGPEVREAVKLFESETLPPSWGTAMIVYRGMQKLESARTYFFPPIIDIKTYEMDDYIASATAEIRSASKEG